MKPVLQALVIAERVYTDQTGKKIIAGTFDKVTFQKITATEEVEMPDGSKQSIVRGGGHAGSPYAYISITDVCDGTELKLQFVSLNKNKVIFENRIRVSGAKRLQAVEIVAPLPSLAPPVLPSSDGVYAFEVLCEGEILGSYRITVEELPAKQQE